MGLTVEQLGVHLDAMSRVPSEKWLSGLEDRKRKELEFHDQYRDRTLKKQVDQDTYEKLYGNEKYYNTTRRSTEYVERWLKTHVPGKIFLDYACGDGHSAIAAAKAGAALSIGIDISPISVQNGANTAAGQGLSDRCRFVQADAENTNLPDNSVDVILCSGMLHHLDLSFAFPELRRILAPGGKILAVEALDYNPLIKLYRMMTPAMRTEWEKAHILSLKDVRFAKRFFDIGEVKYWHVASPLAASATGLLPVFEAFDSVLTRLPLAKLMAWIFTFELKKQAKPS